MGGFNSGRHAGKNCTNDMIALDVRRLQRDGFLSEGRSFSWSWKRGEKTVSSINIKVNATSVTLNYRQRDDGGEWQDMHYPVWLTWTDCNYGGQRTWWRCPGAGCGRRVAVLYGGKVFACRHCYQLAYQCQREAPDDRATRRADKLRDRLGWEPGILNHAGGRPKGMHMQTYWRLQARHDANLKQALAGMMAKLGPLKGLDDIHQMIAEM